MNAVKYGEIANSVVEEARKQVGAKQPDYAQDPAREDSDVLANFKIVGGLEELLRPSPDTRPDPAGFALFTYAMKHLIPWARAVLYGITPKSESLLGRAADLVNYVILGGALASDRFGIDLYHSGADLPAFIKTLEHDPATCYFCRLYERDVA